MEFSCTAEQFADHVVLTVAGDVDLAAHARFESEIEQGWDGSTDLRIDCSGITFLDSMGLRVLVHTLQRATANDRTITLAAPSQPVLRVLELAGVKDLFPLTGPVPDTGRDPAA
ncbi:STAS domain-containing protein [Catenulispora sp. NF23]|uniref:Anti-sigma factor antagonist n=1 Tax=Catenulispora pinistramenti TaxID=2705254 RepID=A0ABS5KNC0_9ACTN|nr:STAS domain-containing protein [Catenulispora pinistramenti]MBS2532829.1 STAS domain-containing protein [Catenulispora pinistramenti]MBS2547506.1 STAS domain-containing protein [Catenulispora pinistramenti]